MREQILRGWSNCFKHAVAKNRFAVLQKFVWKRMIVMLQTRHRWNWTDIRRRYTTRTGRWLPITAADGTVLFDLNSVTVSRYCWRGLTAETVESPLRREAHGGFGERFGETEQEQSRHRAPGLLSDLALCCSVAQQGSLSYLTELSNLFSLSRRTPFRNRQRVSRCSAGASTRRSHV
ncbi:group II intron maturase-specific domain-containing protein [Nocardia sp. NPDC050408]|uniref:group II intron maturase-specific domain-containing protein n=1 Tax=Nocardia sp. NPDC050408 TaxID=3364319 RepID=UPI0037A9819E